MRIDIAYQDPGEATAKLLYESALKEGESGIVKVSNNDISSGDLKKLSENIVWRDGDDITYSTRAAAIAYFSDKIMINTGSAIFPQLPSKLLQQQLLKYSPLSRYVIDTFRVGSVEQLSRLIKEGKLAFPLVSKPEYGSGARGVVYLENMEEIAKLSNLNTRVFQNYIDNDGDWRVFVVGGTTYGAMKKVRKDGQKFNLVVNGARYFADDDGADAYYVRDLAQKAASLFHLEFTGVDIIKDKKTGQYRILEVNTVPGWTTGFSECTGEDIPGAVIGWMRERRAMVDAPKSRRNEAVELYYENRFSRMTFFNRTHFATRMFLWTRDEKYRTMADSVHDEYIGADSASTDKILRRTLNSRSSDNRSRRGRLLHEKYPLMHQWILILFRGLIARTVYNEDISENVRKTINLDDVRRVCREVGSSPELMSQLSSYAVNLIYLYAAVFNENVDDIFDVETSASAAAAYFAENVKSGAISAAECAAKFTYLLTHAVIGKSQFYSSDVTDQRYGRLCGMIEAVIRNNYFEAPLDNKLEFLVAAALCGYETDLEKIILSEADQSVSWSGNFITEPVTSSLNKLKLSGRENIDDAEHTSVLYLMAESVAERRDASRDA
jgi:glutathione synthase/RimK-type ligase-like ATP-grasp enzyme